MGTSSEVKSDKLIWALIILLGAMVAFAYIITYNAGPVLKKTNSIEVVTKLKNIQDKGGEFELTQKNIDELCYLYFSKPKNKGNIMLQGVNIEMLNDELFIQAPVSYKKLNLLFSSQGKLNFSEGEISYSPDNFKIGKLSLPKKLVISQILKLYNKNFYAEDNLIKINPSVFPFKISNLKVIDNKILVSATKLDIKMLFENVNKSSVEDIDKQLAIVEQKIQSAAVLMNEKESENIKAIQNTIEGVRGKSIEEKRKVINDAINNMDNTINKTKDNEKKKELEKIRAEVEKVKKDVEEKVANSQNQTEIKRKALTKVKNELSGAYAQVETKKEQQLISIMISTVSKMVSNPSYDSSSDQASVRSIYGTLDADSRNRVKVALFSSVGGDSLSALRQAFGL